MPQLRREAESLERERVVLQEVQLPALHVALARLNDTHVLEVRCRAERRAERRAPCLASCLAAAGARRAEAWGPCVAAA